MINGSRSLNHAFGTVFFFIAVASNTMLVFLNPLMAHVDDRYVNQAIEVTLLQSAAEIHYSLLPSPLYRASLVPEIDTDGDMRLSVGERTRYYNSLVPALRKQIEFFLDGKRLDVKERKEVEAHGIDEVIYHFHVTFPPMEEGEHSASVILGAFGKDTRDYMMSVSSDEEGIVLNSTSSKGAELAFTFNLRSEIDPPISSGALLPEQEAKKRILDFDYMVAHIYEEGSILRRCAFALAILVIGFLHAIGPGHGKTIAGLYLVGIKSTVRHAVILSFLITFFHIVTIVVLTLAFYFFSAILVSNKYYYPVVRILSGSLIVIIGTSMFVSSLRHSGGNAHDSATPPLICREKPMGWAGLVGLSFSCGIIPCSAGFIIMLTAISQGRVVMGIVVLLLFAIGVLAAIMLVSLAFVKGKLLFASRYGHTVIYHCFSRISFALIIALGFYLVLTALR